MLKVIGDNLNTQEVVDVLAARLGGKVKMEEFVKRDSDWRHEIHEHASQFALRGRVKSQIHRNTLAPVKIVTFVVHT